MSASTQRGARRWLGRHVAWLGFLTLTIMLAIVYLPCGSLRQMGGKLWMARLTAGWQRHEEEEHSINNSITLDILETC
jgi:hypothetical protein